MAAAAATAAAAGQNWTLALVVSARMAVAVHPTTTAQSAPFVSSGSVVSDGRSLRSVRGGSGGGGSSGDWGWPRGDIDDDVTVAASAAATQPGWT